jgi:putative tRNA adenosine deaminase-associated protein
MSLSQGPEGTEGVDFAFVAYREDDEWHLEEIADEKLHDLDTLTAELRRWPGECGTLGLVSIDEDFFVLVRVAGVDTRVLLSDVTAATEWPLARSVVEELDIPMPDDEDEQLPAGDPGIIADLGVPAMEMGAMLDDFDLYPDEILGDIAHRVGFGAQFEDALSVTIP